MWSSRDMNDVAEVEEASDVHGHSGKFSRLGHTRSGFKSKYRWQHCDTPKDPTFTLKGNLNELGAERYRLPKRSMLDH